MKKYILLFVVLVFGLSLISGCKKKEPPKKDEPPVDNPSKPSDEDKEKEELEKLLHDADDATTFRVYFNGLNGTEYQMVEVEFAGNVKSTEVTSPIKKGYVFDGWYQDKECTTKFSWNTVVVNSMMVYAKWLEYTGVDYQCVIDEYVPTRTSEDFVLPKMLDQYPNARFIWSTSDEHTIDPEGIINQAYEDTKVIVTLQAIEGGYSTYYSKECIVEKIEFSYITDHKACFGYYSTWNFSGYTESMKRIDAVILSFSYVNKDLTLDMEQVDKRINEYLAIRKDDVRVLLSIQGYGDNSGNFSAAANNENNRKKFVDNVVEVVTKYHFDGIDLDWEYPGWFRPETKNWEAANYQYLVQELYTRLKAINEEYIVSAAIPGGSEGWYRYTNSAKGISLGTVSDYLDYINIMTYDLEASSRVFHHTALYGTNGITTGSQSSVDDSVVLFMNQGVPKEKIIIGIAFYGKTVTPTSSTNGGIGSNSKYGKYDTITYTNIDKLYLSRLGGEVKEYFDENAKAYYLYDSKANITVTYENTKSIKLKCDYARVEKGLAGVMIWELGEDRTDTLLPAVLLGLKK